MASLLRVPSETCFHRMNKYGMMEEEFREDHSCPHHPSPPTSSGGRHRRPPERGRQRRQRHLVPRERDADGLPGPLGQGHERLGAVGVRPRPRRRDGPQRLPLLGRVGAHRAGRGRVLGGGAGALRGGRRRMPRPRSRADRDVQSLHVAALVRGARRVAGRRGARAVRPLLRRRDGPLRRPHRARRDLQRARPARDADVGGSARLHRRARARDARGREPARPASSATAPATSCCARTSPACARA